ncbi:hypothetical protein GCM10009639_12620 [Kitasatospora putterlickiae]|uniref:Putative restriction endonuclease domain-containing protein n=1 Tax=Kitasatospora putterlickiae TaxID=221725 RepID=A0ABN1XQD3_9ACTN
MPELPVHPGALRTAAGRLSRLTGLGVEVIGGTLVLAPPRRGRHAGTVERLRARLDAGLPDGFAAYQCSSLGMPGDRDDYATPDLVVLPVDWGGDEHWLADPHEAALAVEVVPRSKGARDVTVKSDWYAAAEVRALLVLDPRNGTWTLRTDPCDGAYRGTVRGRYGEPVVPAAPLPEGLSTDGLPLYAG